MIRIKQAGEQAGMQPGNRAERTDGPTSRERAARLRASQPDSSPASRLVSRVWDPTRTRRCGEVQVCWLGHDKVAQS